MFQILDDSLNAPCFSGFFQGTNPLPEFQTPIPPDRGLHGNPSYEDRVSNYIRNNCIHAPDITGQMLLNSGNTEPPLHIFPPRGIKPDIMRYGLAGNIPGLPFLMHNGRNLHDFTECGANYITQPYWYPVNKILMDYAKVMKEIEAVHCTGNFYHVMIISDPIQVRPAARHLINLYGLPDYLMNRPNLATPYITRIYNEILAVFAGVNPYVQTMNKPLDWPLVNPQLRTHFIVVGPLFAADKVQIWQNAMHRPAFNRYEINKPARVAYRNYFA